MAIASPTCIETKPPQNKVWAQYLVNMTRGGVDGDCAVIGLPVSPLFGGKILQLGSAGAQR